MKKDCIDMDIRQSQEQLLQLQSQLKHMEAIAQSCQTTIEEAENEVRHQDL